MDFVLHVCSRLYSLFSSVDENYLCFEYKLCTEYFVSSVLRRQIFRMIRAQYRSCNGTIAVGFPVGGATRYLEAFFDRD